MGWTQYHATHYNSKGQVDRKAEMDALHTFESGNVKSSVVKSCMVGRIYYAAVSYTEENETKVYAAVAITSGKIRGENPWFNFGYKAMSEDCGPYYYDCPKTILDLLTPTDNENAVSWREECRKRLAKPKLSDLPVGTIIKFKRGDTEVNLKKMAPSYQFKRCWWLVVGSNTYMPATRIPADYEII